LNRPCCSRTARFSAGNSSRLRRTLRTRLILARNPAFYTVKKHLLRAKGNQLWPTYNINAPWQAVGRLWPVETVSFASTLRLERKLRKLGMRRSAIKGVLRLVREADRHRLEPRLFIGEWKLRRYRPAPAARALLPPQWGALAGSGAILLDDAVGLLLQ